MGYGEPTGFSGRKAEVYPVLIYEDGDWSYFGGARWTAKEVKEDIRDNWDKWEEGIASFRFRDMVVAVGYEVKGKVTKVKMVKRKNPIGEAVLGGMAAGAAAGMVGAFMGARMGRKNGKQCNPGNHFDMAKAFHGRDSEYETEVVEVVEEDTELAKLGILTELEIMGKGRDKVPIQFAEIAEGSDYLHLDEDMDEYVSLCANAEGSQLYFEGGDQDLSGQLEELEKAGCPVGRGTRFVVVGTVHSISYFGDKWHLTGPKEQKKGMHYIHVLGEETGVKPILVFDVLQRRVGFVGGEYRVEDRGIVN